MKRWKRNRQKVPSGPDKSEPDISDIIPVVEYTPIVVPERLKVDIPPFEPDEDAAATETLINEQRLNDDAKAFNQILNA